MEAKQTNEFRRRKRLNVSEICDYNMAVQSTSLCLPFLFWILYLSFLTVACIRLLPLYRQHIDFGHDKSFEYSAKIPEGRSDNWSYHTMIIHLNPGEDASLKCYFNQNRSTLDILWYLDGMPLQYTWRHKRSHVVPDRYEVLDISFIQESDYGVYTCYVEELEGSFPCTKFITTRTSIIVEPRLPSNVIKHLPVGGVFIHSLTYRVYDNSTYYDYILINNRSYYDTCGIAYAGCSWFVSLFMQYVTVIHPEMPTSNIVRKNRVHFLNMTWESSTLFLCVCPRAYGNITTRFLRTLYNYSSSEIEVFPMSSHVTFTILPRRSPFFTWGAADANSSVDLSTSISGLWLDIKDDDKAVFNVVEILVLIICTALPAYVCFCIVRKIICWILVRVPWSVYHERHQVYIACADKDEQWTGKVLEPYIRCFGHTTYIHNRDANCGGYEIRGINKGFGKCTKFMVVVSYNSLSSPLLEFQVQLLLDQIITKSISAFQVMVVSLQPVHCSVVNDLSRIRAITKFNWSETITKGDSKKTKQSKKRPRKSADSQKDLDKFKSKLKKALYDWLHASSLIKDMFEKKLQRIPFYQSVLIWIVDSVLVYVACKYLTQYGYVYIMIIAVGILTVFVSILFSIVRSSICFR